MVHLDQAHGSEGSPLLNPTSPFDTPQRDEKTTDIGGAIRSEPCHLTPLIDATSQFQDDRNLSRKEGLESLSDSQSWVPHALQKKSFVAFIITFVAMIIALAVLYDYSNKHNGLATSNQKLHYIWTYGPTAVFTVVAACWSKVDYHSRQLAPWRNLASGPSPARQSVLLDYVSALNVHALYSSCLSRNFEVALAISGTLMLQLMIIFSTGLFALEQRTMIRHDAPIFTNFIFANGSNGIDARAFVSYLTALEYIDGRAFMNAMATREYGLPYRNGTTETFAYQTVNMSLAGLPSNTTLTATVDALYPDLECKVLNASFNIFQDFASTRGEGLYKWHYNTNDLACPLITGLRGIPLSQLAGYLTYQSYDPQYLYSNSSDPRCKRWWLFVAHVELDNFNHTEERKGYNYTIESSDGTNQTVVSEGYNITYRNGESSISSIACEPKLEMRKAIIRTNGARYNASIIEDAKPSTLANVSAWDLFLHSMLSEDAASSTLTGTNLDISLSVDNVTLNGPIFKMMNLTMPRLNRTSWMDTDFLIETARKSFQSIATQVAIETLVEPTVGNSTATLEWTENRLVLQQLSFYPVTSLLVLLVAIAVALCLAIPTRIVPRDPGSIAGMAAIVASSSNLNQSLEGVGHSAAMTKIRAIASAPFQSGVRGRSFHVDPSTTGIEEQEMLKMAAENWWRPFYGTLPGRSLALLAPLVAILALELLYHESQQHNGIVDITLGKYSHYSWVYLPAFFVWLINLCFESIYTDSATLYPFHVLRRENASAEDTLTYNLLGNILVRNIWQAFRKRRYAVLFTSITVAVGTALPIAAAGLYSPQQVTLLVSMNLDQTTDFNASIGFYDRFNSRTEIQKEPNANPVASLLLYNNISYPPGTYKTYAFGEFQIDLQAMKAKEYSSISVQIPAVRGRINCTNVPAKDIYLVDDEVQTNVAKGCKNGTGPALRWTTTNYGFGKKPSTDFIFGTLRGASLMGLTNDGSRWPDENKTVGDAAYHGRLTPDRCPRGMITFGRGVRQNITNNISDTISDVTAMHCRPYVERVILNTTFSLPLMEVTSANPLPPDPQLPGGYPFFSEAEILQDAGMSRDPRSPPEPWRNYLSPIHRPNDTVSYALDMIMEAAIWGKDGVPASELLGSANAERLISRVDDVYGTIMAQLYNKRARIPAETSVAPLKATAASQRRYRVVQSLISTRIMTGVLAIMFICCAVSFWLLDTKDVLPQNPCSIAAAASFVAGSKLVERPILPEGSEYLSDQDMINRGIFTGLEFKLGWWGEDTYRRFGIDVVGSEEEKTESMDDEDQDESDADCAPQLPPIHHLDTISLPPMSRNGTIEVAQRLDSDVSPP